MFLKCLEFQIVCIRESNGRGGGYPRKGYKAVGNSIVLLFWTFIRINVVLHFHLLAPLSSPVNVTSKTLICLDLFQVFSEVTRSVLGSFPSHRRSPVSRATCRPSFTQLILTEKEFFLHSLYQKFNWSCNKLNVEFNFKGPHFN